MELPTPQELLHIPEERLATKEETQSYDVVVWDVTKAIASTMDKYILPFPKNKERIYTPDLESARESLQNNQEEENYIWATKDIDYILDNYKDHLSFDDMFDLQLMLVKKKMFDDDLDDAIFLLDHIQKYEKDLDEQQRKELFYCFWLVYFYKADLKNNYFYRKSIEYFDKVLGPDIGKEMYVSILCKKIIALEKLEQYKEYIPAAKEFISLSEDIAETDDYIRDERIHAYEKLWFIYAKTHQKEKAIKYFQKYLEYEPNDKTIQRMIYLLIYLLSQRPSK